MVIFFSLFFELFIFFLLCMLLIFICSKWFHMFLGRIHNILWLKDISIHHLMIVFFVFLIVIQLIIIVIRCHIISIIYIIRIVCQTSKSLMLSGPIYHSLQIFLNVTLVFLMICPKSPKLLFLAVLIIVVILIVIIFSDSLNTSWADVPFDL